MNLSIRSLSAPWSSRIFINGSLRLAFAFRSKNDCTSLVCVGDLDWFWFPQSRSLCSRICGPSLGPLIASTSMDDSSWIIFVFFREYYRTSLMSGEESHLWFLRELLTPKCLLRVDPGWWAHVQPISDLSSYSYLRWNKDRSWNRVGDTHNLKDEKLGSRTVKLR